MHGASAATASAPPLWRLDLRPLSYRHAWDLQRDLVERRQRDEIPDVLLLTEHPPVFTLGKSAHREHLLEPPAQLAGRGAEVIETDRGGDVTFHGPGQLVAYPIVHLGGWKKDVHAYLRALEGAAIETAAWFGTTASRRTGLTGVWCGGGGAPRKLASIGVRVSRWVASHGLAFNVTTDLGWFSHIVPCGIRDSGTTSLEIETGRSPSLDAVADRLASSFADIFGRQIIPAPDSLTAGLRLRTP